MELDERDSQFYIEDGSIIIRARSVLFKVHQSRLAEQSTLFRDMFALPTALGPELGQEREGSSDSNPVVINEDPDEFHTLLWVLYVKPLEFNAFCAEPVSRDKARKLLSIAHLGRKYLVDELDQWAFDKAFSALDTLIYTGDLPLIEKTLVVGALYGAASLQRATSAACHSIAKRNTLEHLLALVALAQRQSIPALEHEALYAIVLRMDWVSNSLVPDDLRQRLFLAYCRLSEKGKLLLFPRHGCTYNEHYCEDTWTHVQQTLVHCYAEFSLADLLGRLNRLRVRFHNSPLSVPRYSMQPACRAALAAAIDARIISEKGALGEYFRA